MNSVVWSFILGITFYVASVGSLILCPAECHCALHGINLNVDCSGLAISELPDLSELEVSWLDLSDNEFTEIPAELQNFPQLEALDMSGNKISHLSGSSLSGMHNLKTLNLARNNISNLMDINPNTLLQPSPIAMLNLAKNPITSFSSVEENAILVSKTLKTLDLSECKIVRMAGNQMLSGLLKIEHLNMAGNPLRTLSSVASDSLTTLNLVNCRLGSLPIAVFANLPALVHVNLARNNRISLVTKNGEYVASESLKRIDLSYCNMGGVEIAGFPHLTTAVLRGNMIRQLGQDIFKSNVYLENLDLSFNAISYVNPGTFKDLGNLKHLDISFNMIPRIDRDTFKHNNMLTTINLSRNYIGRFNRIQAKAVNSLNMSWCEIIAIDADALQGCPVLTELDLSNNLITSIPDNLNSQSLQTLDLSMCRITSIRNSTFSDFPELSRINLSGNRFTTPFRVDFFSDLLYLQEIGLGDNPWRCECRNTEFYKFFSFLVEPPSKIWDKSHLRCNSPDDLYGVPWDVACFHIWYPNGSSLGTAEKVWTIIMVSMIVFAGSICIIMSVRKCIDGRKLTAREREREEFIEHHRDIIRQNRMAMEQEAQLNAPDPRETRPPCYEDAILMPRLDGSFASLNELNMRREKRRKLLDKDENEDETDGVITRRNRCRSEEVLSMRESRTEDGQTRRSRRQRNANPPESLEMARNTLIERSSLLPPPTEPPPPTPPRNSAFRAQDNELHYHSTEVVNLHLTTVEIVPRTPEEEASAGMAEIDQITMRARNDDDTSPYAKRKQKHMSTFKGDEEVILPTSSRSSGERIHVVDDYFAPAESPRKNRSSDEDFESFSSREIDEIPRAVQSDDKRDVGQKVRRPTESDL
ncbi:toll-like receptor 4 [Lutzomyia longipalpis]|uniref:toll-like receptor 4 n=1 Tax=Lutzomyia longipalpis TaxID=7200 RepID=UPI0024844318|nr:toll-like receptor 4 [Lutzomyia longipalpis]